MTAAPPAQLTTPNVDAGEGLPPPEIIRLRRRGTTGDEYYQALGAAAQVRLRLLASLHARGELDGSTCRESTRRRLAAQQNQVWQQLLWLVHEMRRLDEAARG